MNWRKLPAIACVYVCACVSMCVWGGWGWLHSQSEANTHTAKTLQHTQSCIRLYGETNPVTVSGNLSALTRYNLDYAKTDALVTQSVFFFVAFPLFSLSLSFYFIYKWHAAPVTGNSYQWLSKAPHLQPSLAPGSECIGCTHICVKHTNSASMISCV